MIDAHVHLWLSQRGEVNGLPVYDLGEGRSQFGSEVRQMMPPYMTDGVNSAERLLANMNFSQIGGAVVTQEYIDGPQDEYLRAVRRAGPTASGSARYTRRRACPARRGWTASSCVAAA